jgi:hypothetical protein
MALTKRICDHLKVKHHPRQRPHHRIGYPVQVLTFLLELASNERCLFRERRLTRLALAKFNVFDPGRGFFAGTLSAIG